ncbi:unnamed protein product [Callosobruchus maculatus]|uniref:HTH psq-type domain-containing protein n=1 Tax=Callosobruchus maculatus TaxID=64391 RepID=A0A653CQR0_CALMS|nr:unnamed protein product [Callosobruchus maculatus]
MSCTPKDLSNTMHAIRKGRKVREVGRAFNTPESTLRKCKNQQDDGHHLPRLGRPNTFAQHLQQLGLDERIHKIF